MLTSPLCFTDPVQLERVRVLGDADLLRAEQQLARERRRLDAWAVALAGEISRRSSPEFAGEGLARKVGARTPENLIRQLTGSSVREAHMTVRLATTALAPVTAAVISGDLSLAAGDAVIAGLGVESSAASAGELAGAASELLSIADDCTPEQLAVRARELRAQIDESALVAADADRRSRRHLALTPQADGMTRVHGLLDPESAAVVRGAVDAATSPRRGGPRFVASDAAERAERIERDPRTRGQLAVDAIVHLIEAGAVAAPGDVLPPGPALRVVVTLRDLARGSGPAWIEGQSDPVAVPAAERVACSAGLQLALFDESGRALDLGRTQRLFTAKQRAMLALRDGGCRYPGCDRPPSWTEAHHIVPWERGGRTDVRDGILLCRYHHLHLHNSGGEIRRNGDAYVLIPPRSVDPRRRSIPLPTTSPVMRRLRQRAPESLPTPPGPDRKSG